MYVAGIAGAAVFYSTILGVNIWAASKKRKKIQSKSLDDLILGNRDLGLLLGISSLVATWTGGIFIHGTAEAIFSKSLAWCQMPLGYSLSLLFGGILFVKPIRNVEYVTILDPFQQQYGPRFGGLLFLPTLMGDLLWCAAIIKALANTISVISEIDGNICITAALILIIIYTILGGFYVTCVADALQLIFVIFGLAIATPYVIFNPAVVSLERYLIKNKDWLGEVTTEDLADWIDRLLLLIFGGLSCQSYLQQIKSIKNTSTAKIVSVISMICCLTLAVPSALIGLVARETDWSLIENFNQTTLSSTSSILPIILKYLTPQWVSFISLGTILATIMSSASSSILSSSFIFSRNIYRITIRPKATDKELIWILRITVIIIAVISAGIVFNVRSASVYYLSYLSSDLTYVVLFPQLLAVIYWPSLIDTYGCLAGYLVSIIMRIAGGEKKLGLWPPLIYYPFFDQQTRVQKFPFRTVTVISSIIIQLFVSFITKRIFGNGKGTNKDGNTNERKICWLKYCDFLGVYYLSGKKGSKKQSCVAQSSSGAALVLDDSAITQEGSLHDGCDSTDSQEELTVESVNHYHHQQQRHKSIINYEDSSSSRQNVSKESNNIIDLSNFKTDHTLRRGMSVHNTPVTRIDHNPFPKNVTQTPGRISNIHNNNNCRKVISIHQLQSNNNNNNNHNINSGQILAVRNLIPSTCYLTNSEPHNNNNTTQRIINNNNNNNNNNSKATPAAVADMTSSFCSTPSNGKISQHLLNSTVIYGKLESIEIKKDIENKFNGVIVGDRTSLDLNLNLNLNNNFKESAAAIIPLSSSSSSSSSSSTGIVKKNVVGVKLVGMDGSVGLRRPSQSTFSPTPSVELVHIIDNNKNHNGQEEEKEGGEEEDRGVSGIGGPISLSPIPSSLGVEACKIHGTAVGGSGNEHCRIKRGIVRHHSFNETGDRALTTLARQPAYPSMPLRTDDCRMTVLMTTKKDGKGKSNSNHIVRYSSVADDKDHTNRSGVTGRRGLVISPTYGIYKKEITADLNYSTIATVTYTNSYDDNDNNEDDCHDEDDNEAISRF
ncbi:uncharacterized protein LOC130676701 isoform X2 [Microplitis mediator]|nr:uncharacterized protein LOC130676701 isoform X2 [Microplitis mediator]XP_057339122.1 uncharacterized protein LOC130676701 isoform X2 [Microplitis mediator]